MTPAAIAAHLDAEPIAGLTHGLGFGPEATPPAVGEEPYLVLCAGRAEVCLYVNADDFGEVIAVARNAKVFRVDAETLRADLVEILAWSLNATHPDPAAPEMLAALRSPGLYSEVLRKHLEDRRDALAAVDFPDLRPLVAALTAALKETST
jgi:hypothetical protein